VPPSKIDGPACQAAGTAQAPKGPLTEPIATVWFPPHPQRRSKTPIPSARVTYPIPSSYVVCCHSHQTPGPAPGDWEKRQCRFIQLTGPSLHTTEPLHFGCRRAHQSEERAFRTDVVVCSIHLSQAASFMATATPAFGASGKETRGKRGVRIMLNLANRLAASGMYGYGKHWLM